MCLTPKQLIWEMSYNFTSQFYHALKMNCVNKLESISTYSGRLSAASCWKLEEYSRKILDRLILFILASVFLHSWRQNIWVAGPWVWFSAFVFIFLCYCRLFTRQPNLHPSAEFRQHKDRFAVFWSLQSVINRIVAQIPIAGLNPLKYTFTTHLENMSFQKVAE